MEKLFVIKVINTPEAGLRKWYRTKGGELFICSRTEWLGINDNRLEGYKTVGFVDEDCSIGCIEDYYSEVIAEFEYDDY